MGMNSRIRSRSLRNLAAGAAVALAAFTPAASADVIEFSWNLTGDSAPTGVHQRTFTSAQSNPSSVLTARAYATGNNDGTGNIVARNLGLYSGGLGVSGGSDSTSSPNHSLDNVGVNDLILFEFASGGYNPKSITIGWKENDADIQLWVGGPNSAGLNLTTACGGTACDISDLASLGFSTPALEYTDLTVNVAKLLNTTLTGRYLLVAARFEGGEISGGDDDYMKISSLVAKVSRVPEPATAGLLLLGLAALGRSRKARQFAGERAS
jgi:hypothetical protein